MDVLILHQTITANDAIGNDIRYMFSIFSRRHKCTVYCENYFGIEIERITREELLEKIKRQNNLLIYHHSIFWEEGEKILLKTRCRIIIKYHNITPECFFDGINETYFSLCKKGHEQSLRFLNILPDALWMSDSLYNLDELLEKNASPAKCVAIVSPFNNVRMWRTMTPDSEILKGLIETSRVNLFFVGRMVPNKGHDFSLRVLKKYIDVYGGDIVLHLAGKTDRCLSPYNEYLKTLIADFGIQERVHYVGEITDDQLLSYYLGCDFLLCTSLHEGFCLPLIEAQSLCLPVIARRAAAVAETLGRNQVVLEEDVLEYAAAIKSLVEYQTYRDYFVLEGLKNYRNRFDNAVIERKFVQVVENFTGERL